MSKAEQLYPINGGSTVTPSSLHDGEWTFSSESDKQAVEKQFDLIADKFLANHKYDVTIIAPFAISRKKELHGVEFRFPQGYALFSMQGEFPR